MLTIVPIDTAFLHNLTSLLIAVHASNSNMLRTGSIDRPSDEYKAVKWVAGVSRAKNLYFATGGDWRRMMHDFRHWVGTSTLLAGNSTVLRDSAPVTKILALTKVLVSAKNSHTTTSHTRMSNQDQSASRWWMQPFKIGLRQVARCDSPHKFSQTNVLPPACLLSTEAHNIVSGTYAHMASVRENIAANFQSLFSRTVPYHA